MIFSISGLSGHGKTTLINKYCEMFPDSIRFKGAGSVNIGMHKDWQNYNFWMHNIIERLDECNDYKKPILWDRFLTDIVYSKDKEYSDEMFRVIKSHAHKAVIYIKPDINIIESTGRISKEGSLFKKHTDKYSDILSSFKVHEIILREEDQYKITDNIIKGVYEFIINEINSI